MKVDAQSYALQCTGPGPELHVAPRLLKARRRSDVLVDVKACAVNPIDAKRVDGYGARLLSLFGASGYPLVVGNDFSGVIRAVGSDSQPWIEGQRVFGLVPTGRWGSHATSLLIDARWVRVAPVSYTFEQLAVLPYSFTTMWLAVRSTGLNRANAKGKRVLIYGASGALGQLALQLLAPWGAEVTAVSGSNGLSHSLALGAAKALDRRQSPLQTLAGQFDVSLNFGSWADDRAAANCLGRSALGHATTVHPLLQNFDQFGWLRGLTTSVRERRLQKRLLRSHSPRATYEWVVFRPDLEALDLLSDMVAAGRASLPVGIKVPFAEAHHAFSHVTQKCFGRAVLLPGSACGGR